MKKKLTMAERLLRALCALTMVCGVAQAQTVGQWELRKRGATGMTSYGVTAENGKAIGFTAGVPAMIAVDGAAIGGTLSNSPIANAVLFNLAGVLANDADLTFATDTLSTTKLAIGGGTAITSSGAGGTMARTDGTNTFTGVQSMTSPAITTSITTPSTTFTALAGATTLLTIGGTGATATVTIPGTEAATGTAGVGALSVAGGAYVGGDAWINGVRVGRGNSSASTTNLAVGASALNAIGTTTTNTAVGASSMAAQLTGETNTAVGYYSFGFATSGNYNTIIGSHGALQDGAAAALLSLTSCVAVGYNTDFLANGDANSIVIGANSIGEGSNTTVIGNSSTTKVHPYGNLFLSEVAADEADVAGQGQLWVKNTTPNQLWFTDDAGTAIQLGAGGLTTGTTTITSGTDTKVLYNNAGVLGEYTISGSGNVAMTTSPTFTTPALGVATATSINKVAITAPATSATLTIADGKTLTANKSITLDGTDSTTMTFPSVSASIPGLAVANTFTAEQTITVAAATSTSGIKVDGTWSTAGTTTTDKPSVLIEPAGATSTAWDTNGTGLGVNSATGFTGQLLDLQINGTSRLKMSGGGILTYNGGYANVTLSQSGAGDTIWSHSWIGPASGYTRYGFTGATDVIVGMEGSGIYYQRNSTQQQTYRIYDTYTSATDYHRLGILTARASVTATAGATVTASAIIPDGAVVVGVTTKVTTGLGTGSGTTGYTVGDGTDADRWGAITGTVSGTSSDNRDWTAGTIECFTSATSIVLTATGGNFDGTGVIYVSVQYMTGQSD